MRHRLQEGMLAKWASVDSIVKTKVKANLLPVLGAQVHLKTLDAVSMYICVNWCTTSETFFITGCTCPAYSSHCGGQNSCYRAASACMA